MVPHGEHALLGMTRELAAQPLLLRGAGLVVDWLIGPGVEDDHEPGAERVAVVALGGIARGGAEVPVVARGARRVVIVVAGNWTGARLLPSPCRGVAV